MSYWLKLDVQGIALEIQINQYQKYNRDIWDEQWNNIGFSLTSGKWLNYQTGGEILLSIEVEELLDKIDKLLNDELYEIEEIVCIEPDFYFKFYPKRDLRADPKYTFVQKGFEIADIYMEWEIYFWSDGLTDNYISLTFHRENLKMLLNY
ncbi:MAG: WapI family immunity protein [Erysipelotrichaceae bacterium]